MNERREYGDGVGDKVYQLQLVVVEQTAKEIPHWEVEAALKVRCEDDLLHHVLIRELLPNCSGRAALAK
jgi:hypothetical protein